MTMLLLQYKLLSLNSLAQQNGRYFADDISKCIFFTICEVCSLASNWQQFGMGLDNDLVPFRRQAIIWTNFDMIIDPYMRHRP